MASEAVREWRSVPGVTERRRRASARENVPSRTHTGANATARHIAIPTLLVNAEDDPFLTPGCHLLKEAENHPFLHTERTQHGGHVAFITGVSTAPYHEQLVHSFFERATQESP